MDDERPIRRATGRCAVVAAAICALLTAACGGRSPPPAADLTVFTSVPPQAWFVEQMADTAHVQVEVMVPPGASPRTYEPSMRQMRLLSRGELYLALGHPRFPFEAAWLGPIRNAGPELRVVETGRRCRLLEEDPHIWLSPRCARKMAEATARALVDARPRWRAEVEARLEGVLARIAEVDRRVRERLHGLEGRSFLVFHPAWSYFARHYGLEQLAIEVGGTEPNPDRLAAVIREARRKELRVIFVQPQFSRQAARVVAGELGGRVEILDPLGRDWPAILLRAAAALQGSRGS